MSKVLITGVGGFIGSHLVEHFIKEGFDVKATDLPNADFSIAQKAGAEIIHSDITDIESLKKVVVDCDIVVHCAAIFNFSVPWDTISKINIEGTKNIAQISSEQGVKRFVQFSSVGVYGLPKDNPCSEDSPKNPRNVYERSKWEAEKVAFEFDNKNNMRVTAIRPTIVYGPRSKYGHAMHLGIFSILSQKGYKKIPVVKKGPIGHHVHVDDVSAAVCLLATHENAVGRSFNIADNTPIPIEEFMCILMENTKINKSFQVSSHFLKWGETFIHIMPRIWHKLLNKRIRRLWNNIVKKNQLEPALDVVFDYDWLDYLFDDHVYDTTSIKQLGFCLEHPNFRDGFKKTVEWYREQKWIP